MDRKWIFTIEFLGLRAKIIPCPGVHGQKKVPSSRAWTQKMRPCWTVHHRIHDITESPRGPQGSLKIESLFQWVYEAQNHLSGTF